MSNPLKDPRAVVTPRNLPARHVKDEYKPLLEAHAAYLKSNRNAA